VSASPPNAAELRAAFDGPAPLTVGVEEELMLLDPESLDLAPRADDALGALAGDTRYKLELPASHLEITLGPLDGAATAAAELASARARLVDAVAGIARPAAAGVHPFAAAEGELNRGARYDRTLAEHATVARRQLVCALQVHVAVGSADATLAVHNALRSYLPELAALAANAPLHEGRDTGLASIRPVLGGMLPRQGVPPAIPSWEAYADALRWGAESGTVPEPAVWWWELRPHPSFGTLELRVPDAQVTVADAEAITAMAHALVAWLAGRHADGDPLGSDPTWRIAENRWSACRYGVEGTLADLETGARRSTREVLAERLATLAPVAARLGGQAGLAHAHTLLEANGAMHQRQVAADAGAHGVAAWLAEQF